MAVDSCGRGITGFDADFFPARASYDGSRITMNHIEIFLEMLAAEKGRSAKTLEAYGRDLRMATDAIGNLSGATTTQLEKYLAGLHEAPASIARKTSALRQFFQVFWQRKK